ncbi:phosphopantetheine adenylyltransferase [Methanohalobium sp.]|uniref:phosphopantetheine adenylyltransferase n=1 Tax=Methanohalobium sp. TaxID=2837493 RepID=UPI0025F78E7E|nr:phosphopantetheine adenylyltransferase [Methanohalobium sp.]
MAKVAVGGTFQYIHDGHKKLINKSFELANDGQVDIGITSDEMARKQRLKVTDYNTRKKNLVNYIETLTDKNSSYQIFKLTDPYGPTLTDDYDYIVVSSKTYESALELNKLRQKRGLEPIEILKIECVMAEDSLPISSTRIMRGEIDIHGNLKY